VESINELINYSERMETLAARARDAWEQNPSPENAEIWGQANRRWNKVLAALKTLNAHASELISELPEDVTFS
jgi:hypothetical protein